MRVGQQPLSLRKSWGETFGHRTPDFTPKEPGAAFGRSGFPFWFLKCNAIGVLLLLILIGVFLGVSAWPALKSFGFRFITGTDWDPGHGVFGSAPFIFGTVLSTLVALVLATPLSIGIALFLNELAPRSIARPHRFSYRNVGRPFRVSFFGLWGILCSRPVAAGGGCNRSSRSISDLSPSSRGQRTVGMMCAVALFWLS